MEIFDYDNILLLPRKCRVDSRAECDASVEFGGRRFNLPVVPANMKTVVDEGITEWLAANGYFYVMHRFDLDNVAFARRMREQGLYVSISAGVNDAEESAAGAMDQQDLALLQARGQLLEARALGDAEDAAHDDAQRGFARDAALAAGVLVEEAADFGGGRRVNRAGAAMEPEVAAALGGLSTVAPLHNAGSWLFLSFFVLHVYLVTTGRTPTEHLESMITGWQPVESDGAAPERSGT